MFAGRIQPLKAPDVLLRAVALLLERDPALRSRLVVPVVGGPSGSGLEHPESVAQLADALGIADVVRFVPPVAQSELADWYAAATLVCVPSYNESFGLVAVEAQAAGTPVVAAAVGGLTTVVRDGSSGFLVEGHDPADYAAVMARIVDQPALRAELSRGRRRSRPPSSPGTAPPSAPSRSTARPRRPCGRTWQSSPHERPRSEQTEQAPGDRGRPVRAGRTATWSGRSSPRASSAWCCPARRSSRRRCGSTSAGTRSRVHAFVARHPDENHERVYRWLLERNLKLFGVAFAVDHMGDIYLDGRVPLTSVTPDEIDRLLGAVLSYADESFNTDPRARVRLLDPQGVGLADLAGRVDQEPRGVPRLAGALARVVAPCAASGPGRHASGPVRAMDACGPAGVQWKPLSTDGGRYAMRASLLCAGLVLLASCSSSPGSDAGGGRRTVHIDREPLGHGLVGGCGGGDRRVLLRRRAEAVSLLHRQRVAHDRARRG